MSRRTGDAADDTADGRADDGPGQGGIRERAAGEHPALVEEFGLHIGRAMSWPRMAGRVAAVLLLSEGALTLGQLQERLGASKGSVSEMTRLLIASGTVERRKEPGRRHFVYEWRGDAWAGCLQHMVDSTVRLRELAAGARGTARLTATQRERLTAMHEFYAFLATRLDGVLSEYTGGEPDREADGGAR
ncbi:hypothetical protein [Streptomyces sp. ODS28]|uniref:GbsR/MarR family transcriptional regulator n=1 Tax=Streptomyces sp. ODS28 TaxID=3136688 RepID=UPI0031E5CB3F